MIEHGIQIASLCMMLVLTINFFIHLRNLMKINVKKNSIK